MNGRFTAKPSLYTLPHGIEVVGEYKPSGKNKYWRVRIREHEFFNVAVIGGGMKVRRSRVIMSSIVGRRILDSEIVHHKNEDLNDDSPANLELMSAADHNRHHKAGFVHSDITKSKIRKAMKRLYASGEKKASVRFGEENTSAKLNPCLVRMIRESSQSANSLAKELGVSKPTVLAVRNNKTWKNIL